MKYFLMVLLAVLSFQAQAQDKEKVQAAKGVVYGTVSEETSAVSRMTSAPGW